MPAIERPIPVCASKKVLYLSVFVSELERCSGEGDCFELKNPMMDYTVTSRILGVETDTFGKFRIHLPQNIAGYRKNPQTGVKEPQEVDYVCVSPNHFLYVCRQNWLFNLYTSCCEQPNVPMQDLQEWCRDAEITFSRSETFDGCGTPRGYSTHIERIVFRENDALLKSLKSQAEAYCKIEDNPACKAEKAAFEKILAEEGITTLYHFTDRRNLASIRRRGGLFSWFYCEVNGWDIPYGGGNESSRRNDLRNSLHDYVRLSFCSDHPMRARLEQEGADLVVLEIEPQVVLWRDTLFSDMNAADANHRHSGELEMFRSIRFEATRKKYVAKTDSDFKYHQAEVLVKTHVPLRFIRKLDELLPKFEI